MIKAGVSSVAEVAKGALVIAFLSLSFSSWAQENSAVKAVSSTADIVMPFESSASSSLQEKDRQLQEAEARLLQKLSNAEAAAPVRAGDSKAQQAGSTQSSEAGRVAVEPKEKSAPAREDKKPSPSPLVKLQSENDDLLKKLRQKDARIGELQKELDEARNRLILAETEVERLSNQLDARNRSSLSRLVAPAAKTQPERTMQAPLRTEARQAAPRVEAPAPEDNDMQIATVISDKVHLRTGPGENNSPIMDVTRGTRLTVETRKGNWLRVNTPAGTRAWISSEHVEFGSGKSSSALRIRGYDASAEEEAFKLLSRSGSR